MVDKDVDLCLPEPSERQTLGEVYVPMARVGLIEVSLVFEELSRNRYMVSPSMHLQHLPWAL